MPPGDLPSAIGCAVFNTFTAYAIYRACYEGRPAFERVVTVSGSGVAQPQNRLCRVGTPVGYIFENCGGFKKDPNKVLMGGPMMGVAVSNLEGGIAKGTNALLAFCENEDKTVKNPVCIRCGRCASACPMKLQPMYMYMYQQKDDVPGMEQYHIMDCIECGACTYGCPGRLHLTHAFRTGKAKIQGIRRAEKAAADAAKAKAEAEKAAGKEAK